jgi:hypothetical protein
LIARRFNLAEHCLRRAALATPDKTALIVVGDAAAAGQAERWTYAALDLAVRRVAAGLLAEGLMARATGSCCGCPTPAIMRCCSSAPCRPAWCPFPSPRS